MTSDVKNCLIFTSGLVVGAVGTWLIVKEKYRAKAEEEIASVKETFTRINKEAIEKAAIAKNKPDLSIYTQALENARASQAEEDEDEEEEETQEVVEVREERPTGPYIISTNEFASDLNGYTKITFFRFTDDIYTDETYEQVNPISYIGREMVNYIRSCKEDEVCIRNDSIRVDVDVALEDRTFKEYMST